MNWDVIIFSCSLLISAIAWLINENSKRKNELKKEKEKRYEKLIQKITSFSANYENADDKIRDTSEFIKELQLAWMYCSSEVILRGRDFLNSLNKTFENENAIAKQERISQTKFDLIYAIRKDLTSRKYICGENELTKDDFLDVSYTP